MITTSEGQHLCKIIWKRPTNQWHAVYKLDTGNRSTNILNWLQTASRFVFLFPFTSFLYLCECSSNALQYHTQRNSVHLFSICSISVRLDASVPLVQRDITRANTTSPNLRYCINCGRSPVDKQRGASVARQSLGETVMAFCCWQSTRDL